MNFQNRFFLIENWPPINCFLIGKSALFSILETLATGLLASTDCLALLPGQNGICSLPKKMVVSESDAKITAERYNGWWKRQQSLYRSLVLSDPYILLIPSSNGKMGFRELETHEYEGIDFFWTLQYQRKASIAFSRAVLALTSTYLHVVSRNR